MLFRKSIPINNQGIVNPHLDITCFIIIYLSFTYCCRCVSIWVKNEYAFFFYFNMLSKISWLWKALYQSKIVTFLWLGSTSERGMSCPQAPMLNIFVYKKSKINVTKYQVSQWPVPTILHAAQNIEILSIYSFFIKSCMVCFVFMHRLPPF